MQILERIVRIMKSSTATESSTKSIFENEDDELRRIIDELNSKSKSQQNDNKDSKKHNQSYPNESAYDKYFVILGLQSNADNETIKSAYKKKMKEYHPDKFSHLSENIRRESESKAKDINEAYNKIRKFRGF